jgi:hypothetical protein
MIGGARGASPTDVSSVMTSSFVVQIKAFVCRSRSWGLLCRLLPARLRCPTMEISDGLE